MKSEDDLRRALRQYEDERWTLRETYERELARLNARIQYLRATLARAERKRKSEQHQKPPAEDQPEAGPVILRTYRSPDGWRMYVLVYDTSVAVTVYEPEHEQPWLVAEQPRTMWTSPEEQGYILIAEQEVG